MIEGKTKSGFKFKVDPRIQKDWRLINAIVNAQSEDATLKLQATVEMVKLILGDQEELFMNHIMNKNDGFLPMEVINTEITEIIQAIPKAKN